MIDEAVDKLACYAQRTGLVDPCERIWAVNAICLLYTSPSPRD